MDKKILKEKKVPAERDADTLMKVINLVEKEGRILEKEIAKRLSKPRSSIQARVNKLSDYGILKREKEINGHKVSENFVVLEKR